MSKRDKLGAEIISLENEIEAVQEISTGSGHAAKAAKKLLPLKRKRLKELYQKFSTKTSNKYTNKEVAHMFADQPSRFDKDVMDNLDEWSGLS